MGVLRHGDSEYEFRLFRRTGKRGRRRINKHRAFTEVVLVECAYLHIVSDSQGSISVLPDLFVIDAYVWQDPMTGLIYMNNNEFKKTLRKTTSF